MSLTAIDPVWVENLSDIYVFRGYAEVSGFLRGHSYLFPTLIEAHQVIEKHFGDRTPVVLKVFTDPESDEDVELFALIQTSLPLDDALERLNDLDEEWWLEASSQTECRLNIDVEYI